MSLKLKRIVHESTLLMLHLKDSLSDTDRTTELLKKVLLSQSREWALPSRSKLKQFLVLFICQKLEILDSRVDDHVLVRPELETLDVHLGLR